MQTGSSLPDLLESVLAETKDARDLIVPERKIRLATEGKSVLLDVADETVKARNLMIRPWAHTQLQTHFNIPKVYYDRMLKEDPALLAQNVNAWAERSDSRRLLRTVGGDVRAVLSDRYRPRDNYDLLQAVLPVARELRLSLVSSKVTERNLFLQFVNPALEDEFRPTKVGDPVQCGIAIRNSEVGSGAISLESLVWRLECKNGLIMEHTMRRAHIGRKLTGEGEEEISRDWIKDETVKLEDQAFFAKVQDVFRYLGSDTAWSKSLGKLRGVDVPLPDDTVKVLDRVQEKLGLTQEERDASLRNLISGSDLTGWGLVNAVTKLAHDSSTYDRAVEIERAGGSLVDWILEGNLQQTAA